MNIAREPIVVRVDMPGKDPLALKLVFELPGLVPTMIVHIEDNRSAARPDEREEMTRRSWTGSDRAGCRLATLT